MIKAIIFDCFGVLYSDNISRLYNMVPREKYPAVHDLIRSIDRGHLTYEEFITQMSALSGKSEQDVTKVVEIQHDRNNALIEKIKRLKNDYKTGLLTNVNTQTIDRLFPKQERQVLFDATVISGEVGMIKPEPEIYLLAAERLLVSPQECLFIDDSHANTEGAKTVGMQAIRFVGNAQLDEELARHLKAVDA